MEFVSFDKPFFDQMAKYPIRFSIPVFFGESPILPYAASLRNGTGSLIKLGGKYLGVTCEHVISRYRTVRDSKTVFQFGLLAIDPEEQLISESCEYDLAVFDLTRFVGHHEDFTAARFVEPTIWPPRDVSRDDVICLGGFPGIWREQITLRHLRFYSFSSGASQVHSVGQHHLMTRIEVEQCINQFNNGVVMGSLAGLSGGPVFAWRREPILTAELVGFVCEYQGKLDLMYVRLANVLREDGTLI
jgi:hypothetical protein